METTPGFLCVLIAVIVCEANCFRSMFKENEKIESPENCTVFCPDLSMSMETFYIETDDGRVTEYRSTIDCSPNFLPYKYLPYTNSNRNSLVFKNCETPEDGFFGDGWPRLEFLNSKIMEILDRCSESTFVD